MSQLSKGVRFRRDHRWSRGQMSAYLDQELAPSGRQRIERHLEHCPECRHLLAALRALLAALHRSPAPTGVDALAITAAVRGRLSEPPAS